ncbi:MAG: hypothetical protein ABW221_03260 [Vicinamibacteria bacterium]
MRALAFDSWIGVGRAALTALAAVWILFAPAGLRSEVRAEPVPAARQQTLRALAAYLDDTAQGLLEGASDSLLRGMTSEARFVSSIRAFARSARELRAAIDGEAPFDVDARLAALAEVARALDERLRAAGALSGTRAEWEAVRDVLERMRALLSGTDVAVPDAYVVPALSGERLDRFRALAEAVEADAAEGYALAREKAGRYPSRGTQFVGELRYFAAATRDLRVRVAGSAVGPKALGPAVDDLLAEARDADGRMRAAQVFTEVWEHSSRIVAALQQMARLVRS